MTSLFPLLHSLLLSCNIAENNVPRGYLVNNDIAEKTFNMKTKDIAFKVKEAIKLLTRIRTIFPYLEIFCSIISFQKNSFFVNFEFPFIISVFCSLYKYSCQISLAFTWAKEIICGYEIRSQSILFAKKVMLHYQLSLKKRILKQLGVSTIYHGRFISLLQ